MAENQEQMKLKEREIPVFTVLKNNCILKNIFVLDNPPPLSSSSSVLGEGNGGQNSEIEEILLVGRHPDCNIKLEHPSISRFHLRIHSSPSSRSLFVTDLSSVHGTFVSGKRIEPGVKTQLLKGDTLKLGESSRLYRLDWVPISFAYETNHSFLPQLDSLDAVDEETEGTIDLFQDENRFPSENEFGQCLSDKMEALGMSMQEAAKEKDTVDEETEVVKYQNGDSLLHRNDEIMEDLEWPVCGENISLPEIGKETSPQVHVSCSVTRKESQPEAAEQFEMNSERRGGLNIWSRRGKSESVKIETSRSKAICARIDTSSPVKPILDEDCENKSMLKDHFVSPDKDKEIFTFTPDKENASPKSCLVTSLGSKFDEALRSVDEDEEAFTSDKENRTPNSNLLRSLKKTSNLHKRSLLKTVSHSSINREESIRSTLDCQQRAVLQELTSTSASSKSHGRLRKQPNVLNAENREPFLPLPVISAKVASIPSVEAATISYSDSQEVNQPRRTAGSMATENSWTIVVDSACLLNKKSRRELQLLRGLRGTHLVIPRIVLRELDCMVRRASFLSRMTEASAALQWIEECMASTKWWIHVQSSAEESRLVPPTPPASSAHWFNEDRGAFPVGSVPFSPYTLQEIVSPTATDHILESALFFKQQTTTGQFVLLSDDVTLKIKAMAEGVICETAKEFRASLINPFSARFLYADSSPRGPTWTCLDDTVLKEKYYPSPTKKTVRSGEGAKGLKLILLHNSNFRQLRA